MRLLLFITSLLICFELSAQCSFTFNSTSPGCYGECTGYIHALPSGTAPFTYNWSTGDSTDILFDLCAGNYVLTLSDSTGCVFIDSVQLIDPPPLSSYITATSPSTPGACDASITPFIQGGTPPYFIGYYDCVDSIYIGIWLAVGIPYSNMCAGQHSIVTTDANGCIDTATCVTINDPVANIGENENTIKFTWQDQFLYFDEPITELTLYDLQGKFVMAINAEIQQALFTDAVVPGVYIIHFKSLDGRLFKERLVIRP